MGEQAKKKRDAARAAERKAKKDTAKLAEKTLTSTVSSTPAIPPVPEPVPPKLILQPRAASKSTVSVRCSTRSHSTSAPSASHEEDTVPSNPHPHRSALASATNRLLLQTLVVSSDESEVLDTFDEEQTEPDDLDRIVGHNSLDGDSDINTGKIQVSPTGQLGISAHAPSSTSTKSSAPCGRPKKKNVKVIEEESDSDNNIATLFNIIYEIHDSAKGSRCDLTLPSSTCWQEVLDKVAEKLNVHPLGLRLQYLFSNEKTTALPFELDSEQAYIDMQDKYRQLLASRFMKSGQLSKRNKTTIAVQLFDQSTKGGGGGGGGVGSKGKGKPTAKALAPPVDAPVSKINEIHEKKKAIAAQITELWTCPNHSHPNKPVLCWQERDRDAIPFGPCYPITLSNVNFWTTLVVQNPDVYKPEVKPLQVPVKKNGARNHVGGRPGADGQNVGALTQPMLYGYYPSLHPYYPIQQQGWPGVALPYGPSTQQMVGPGFQHQEPSMPIKSTAKGPAIANWLRYCDNHQDCKGAAFCMLAEIFEEQGYRTIEQLMSTQITVVDMSTWLGIGKGTADLIIQYADEDMNLVRNGMFRMDNAVISEYDWATEE